MKVIPVIDIKDRIAVRAIGGKRNEYKPLKSKLVESSNPLDVAKAYKAMGFRETYIADLDGILYSKPNLDIIEKISKEMGISIIADLGRYALENSAIPSGITPVIASETFNSLKLFELFEKFIVSIDIKNNQLLCEMPFHLHGFVDMLKDIEINEIMVLDMDRIGMSSGPNLSLCNYILKNLPRKSIIYGGGIRNSSDLELLRKIGVSKALIGSAIHSGTINWKNE